MSGMPLSFVKRLLSERIGLDSASVGESLIDRGVQVRMIALNLHSRADYERVLLHREDELQDLVEEIVVPESWFFRDDRPFQVLAGCASAGWLVDQDRPPLSALSIPCAGGEEPYSIAMTLLEAGLPAQRFRVDAVDISVRALARAIAGVYGSNSFRGAKSLRQQTFFLEKNGSFTIDLAIRSSVRFHLGNLIDPTLFADHPPFDVVFCRNVLIYLGDDARHRAFVNLARLVADGGLLFLGHADRVDQPAGLPFEAIEDKGSFAYRKVEFRDKKVPATSSVPKVVTTPHFSPPLQPRAREPEKTRPEPKKAIKITPTEPVEVIFDRASNLADLGRYGEASALIEGVIRDGEAGARAFFLLGLIDQATGARDRAEAHYLKTIYLDPQHDEALLALAMLAQRKGDLVAEAVYRRRAERVLARKVVP